MRFPFRRRRLAAAWRRWGEPARRFGVAAWVLRFMMLTPTPLAADAGDQEPAQDLRLQDVLIEGRLYSPQALFLLSRPAEPFGNDAVLPHSLGRSSPALLLPYRVRTDVYATALPQTLVAAGDSTRTSFDSRRTQ